MRDDRDRDGVCAAPALGPQIVALMHSIGLDAAYHRAAGDSLFYRHADGQEVSVLDLVGGYGTLLLGHHHPELVAALTGFLAMGRPVHAQGSLRPLAEKFAMALAARLDGDHHVVLANTGSEAVEAALKHAILATGGNSFIALEGAFHGKTLAALSLAGHSIHREPFESGGWTANKVRRVRLNDIEHLEAIFDSHDRSALNDGGSTGFRPAGFIFEPIQGEGGVHSLNPDFAQRAAELCRQHRIPMIADECQTGLGRTGRFLACEHMGLQPDYVVLSKALGGGLVKIAATLIRRDRYQNDFDLKQTSTFAGDELSCAVALRVLELTDEALLGEVRRRGARWFEGLRALAQAYPDVIADVRGRGLMLAVELRPQAASASFVLRVFSATEDLALLAAGFLLRQHGIRIAPTLSCPNTLRVQPCVMVSDAQMDRAIEALRRFCECVRQGDTPLLTAHLSEDAHLSEAATLSASHLTSARKGSKLCSYQPTTLSRSRTGSVRRVAWLCHLIDDTDLCRLDPSFNTRSRAERERLLARLAPLANPVVLSEVEVRSRTGQSVWLYPILLPVTSSWMKACMERGASKLVTSIVQKGIDQAEQLGCMLAALGQYTSIVTRGGRRLESGSIGLCTGNTYSLSLALDAVVDAERQRGLCPSRAICGVIGAGGNIGQTAAQWLASRYRQTLLLGSSRMGSAERLRRLASTLPRTRVIEDPRLLRSADVILAATSATDRPIHDSHLADHAIVCDLSVPTVLSDRLQHSLAERMLIQGGIARLPCEENLHIVGFPLAMGRTYGCMAEALLLGFENIADRSFTGRVRSEGVRLLSALGRRHGFELDHYKDHCVLGTKRRGETHVGVA